MLQALATTVGQVATPGPWRIRRWSRLLSRIDALEAEYGKLSDADLSRQSLELRYRARSGEPTTSLVPEAFALVRTAAHRTIGMRHFNVQLLGGMALVHDSIAEMQTGEGKTLTATLPLYLHGLRGRGAHYATTNDYLASRDAEIMAPLFVLLRVSVGVIQADMGPPERQAAYACDITYAAAREFGFDFLRDRLAKHRQIFTLPTAGPASGSSLMQRGLHFALVDEADSVLIDDARTPLVISAIPGEAEERQRVCFGWASKAAQDFTEKAHYTLDPEKRTIELTFRGRERVRSLKRPRELDQFAMLELYDYIERSIKVLHDFQLDRDYIIRDGEVVIIDQSTGRIAEGRRWRAGVHQAIEAKESAEITVDAGQAARITVQDFFSQYQHLAGMTGTAITSRREFQQVYKRQVVQIPTNRPMIRERYSDRTYASAADKWEAIVAEVRKLHATGRPVLVGTCSIEKSEHLSRLLIAAGLDHQVLNAHRVAEEAEIVELAGQHGKITVATNMAGRGTDIKLGSGVHELGGLHVICSELHDSPRIDRQLVGRSGRQGDPGSYRAYLSLDDEILLRAHGKAKVDKQRKRHSGGGATPPPRRLFDRAQQLVERRHLLQRKILLHQEREIKKMHREMGQDPYLESPY